MLSMYENLPSQNLFDISICVLYVYVIDNGKFFLFFGNNYTWKLRTPLKEYLLEHSFSLFSSVEAPLFARENKIEIPTAWEEEIGR